MIKFWANKFFPFLSNNRKRILTVTIGTSVSVQQLRHKVTHIRITCDEIIIIENMLYCFHFIRRIFKYGIFGKFRVVLLVLIPLFLIKGLSWYVQYMIKKCIMKAYELRWFSRQISLKYIFRQVLKRTCLL